jgi:RNA polymerase sigma-70 factor (ECF subfamily)
VGYTLKTSWTLIQGASEGEQAAREEFSARYGPVIQAYLFSRWRNSVLLREIEDAMQEVFVECFKQGGVLSKADQERPGGFRAFFYGLVRNIARKIEERARGLPHTANPSSLDLEGLQSGGESPSVVFDRAWARSIVKEATALQSSQAQTKGEGALKRMEILRLRFQEGLTIRAIADLWESEYFQIYRQYVQARDEFEAALREVIALETAGTSDEIEKTLADLLAILG